MKVYFIFNVKDDELRWNNDFGWVQFDYDTFNQEERDRLNLPINGAWCEEIVQ